MISTSKIGERKILKPVPEIKALVKKSGRNICRSMSKEFKDNLNSLINKAVKEDKKMEEDQDFLLSDNANQENILGGKKKKIWCAKTKTAQHEQDQISNVLTNISYNGVKQED